MGYGPSLIQVQPDHGHLLGERHLDDMLHAGEDSGFGV